MHNEVLEDLVVVKRSGQRVPFNASKVALAIKKAFDISDKYDEHHVFKVFEKVLTYINKNFYERKTINVEDIQDIVENILYQEKYFDIYESFKGYREKRSLSRKVFTEKSQHKFAKAIEIIEDLSSSKDSSKNSEDLIYDFGRIISSEYTKSYILDNKMLRAMEEGNIYIHDLDYFSLGTFPSIHYYPKNKIKSMDDIDKLILDLIRLQKEVYGEISIIDVDKLLNDYLLNQIKSQIYNEFINYLEMQDLTALVDCKSLKTIIYEDDSLNYKNESFSEILKSDKLLNALRNIINKAKDAIEVKTDIVLKKLFNTLEKECIRKNSYTFSFGLNNSFIGTIVNKRIINILQTIKYNKVHFIYKVQDEIDSSLLTSFVNNIYINLSNEDYFSNSGRIHENINNNENFALGRLVVSQTSINLSRLGMKCVDKSIEEFYKELESMTEVVKNELLLSFETIGNKTENYYRTLFKENVFDDEKLEPGQKIRKVIKNGVLNIGLVGIRECAMMLSNNKVEQEKIILEILKFMNNKCQKYSSDNKINFCVCETSNLKIRKDLLAIDKAIYGLIPKITNKENYELLDYSNNYEALGKLMPYFTGGKRVIIKVNKTISNKKLNEIFAELVKNNISFIEIQCG